jgi:hypothetical protein
MAEIPVGSISELLSAPLGELISSIGHGVGEAQAALDAGSLKQTLDIYREDVSRNEDEKNLVKLMREIGYQPTFYVLPETKVEAQVMLTFASDNSNNTNLSLNQSENASSLSMSPLRPVIRNRIYALPANANNTNKYNINLQACAKITFNIVPVPPNAVISEMRIVPDLLDKPFNDETKKLIFSLGLNYKLSEDSQLGGIIVSQIPVSDTVLKVGDMIEITLEG